jgi:PadR family transcriptional regulator PadR
MRKDFRTGWLLLLIRGGPGHGYELRHELRERALEVDRAVMYRTLREMEQSGLICSRWASSKAGPRRRIYDITEAGLDELGRIAVKVEGARDAHDAFLAAYRRRDGAGP